MIFDNKTYKELWKILDAEDRARLIFLCDYSVKEKSAILLIDVDRIGAKEATRILSYADERSFDRLRARALTRMFKILNSPKHNKYYADILTAKTK